MHEPELLAIRQPVVREVADVAAEARMRIGVGEARSDGHRGRREKAEELRADFAARNLGRGRHLEILFEERPGGAPERSLRREAVEHGHVLENVAHPIAVALAVALVQHARQTLGVGGRMARANEAALNLGRRAAHRFRVQRIAAEKVDLLQLRKQSRARVAARRALHFLDGQELGGVETIRVELVAAVEMPGDDERVAAHALMARRGEPIRPSALDQLDEAIVVARQVALENVLLVGRIDGDRADRLRLRDGDTGPRGGSSAHGHDGQSAEGGQGQGNSAHGLRASMPRPARSGHLQAPDQRVDHVVAAPGFPPGFAQRPDELGTGDRAVIGADQHAGDRRLDG